MFEIITPGARKFMECCLSIKVIDIDVMNDVRRLYFGGDLLSALFSEKGDY